MASLEMFGAMRFRSSKFAFSALLAFALLSVNGQAATFVSVGNIVGGSISYESIYFFEGEPDQPPSSNIAIFNRNVVGLQQFDPALGTVTGITVSANFTLDTDVNLEVFEVDDFFAPHTAGFTMTDGVRSGVDAAIRYNRSNEPQTITRRLLTQNFDTSGFCSGAAEAGECFGTTSASFAVDGSNNVFDNPTSAQNLLEVDYLGTGLFPEGQIRVASVVYEGQLWEPGVMTTNILTAEGGIDIGISAGTVTLTYEYNPVPVPAAVWLFASAVGFMTLSRRLGNIE